MEQRRATTLRRPSGTDGSDYSYRMVVESRYQLVAKAKQRLPLLFILQALFLLIGMIFALLPAIEKKTPNTVAFSSVIVSLISLVIAEIGRRQSRASFLRFHAFVSSIATILLAVSLVKQYSLLKPILGFESSGTGKSDVNDFPAFRIGMMVYIFTQSLIKVFTIRAIVSLVFNMSPPKKAS